MDQVIKVNSKGKKIARCQCIIDAQINAIDRSMAKKASQSRRNAARRVKAKKNKK